MKTIKKKISKKIEEIKRYCKDVRLYTGSEPVIYMDLPNRTKVRTYLNLIIRLNQQYNNPIVIKFSVFKWIILARWFKDFPNIYFAKPLYKLVIFKKVSFSSSAHIRVNYNYSKVHSSSAYIPNALPYCMHPVNYLINEPELLPKAVGIIMSGNLEATVYNTHHMKEHFGILNRWQIFQELLKHPKTVQISGQDLIKSLSARKYISNLVIMQWQTGALSTNDWRHYLSASKFVWCAPGMTMPLCHNILEAMSVGVVPVLNYENWLNPSLIPNTNCLVYKSLDDIPSVLENALNLSEDEYNTLRKGAITYYNSYYKSFDFEEIRGNELVVLNETKRDIV